MISFQLQLYLLLSDNDKKKLPNFIIENIKIECAKIIQKTWRKNIKYGLNKIKKYFEKIGTAVANKNSQKTKELKNNHFSEKYQQNDSNFVPFTKNRLIEFIKYKIKNNDELILLIDKILRNSNQKIVSNEIFSNLSNWIIKKNFSSFCKIFQNFTKKEVIEIVYQFKD